jgi:hypothetical protein
VLRKFARSVVRLGNARTSSRNWSGKGWAELEQLADELADVPFCVDLVAMTAGDRSGSGFGEEV